MLILVGHATTPDKLKMTHGTTADLDTHVSYVDASTAVPPVVQGDGIGSENHTFTTAGTNDILAGNTNASERRNVKYINIRNVHASVTTDVTIILDAIDGNDYELHKATLAPGDLLTFTEGVGWFETQATPATSAGGASNFATAASAAGFASDTYVTGSSMKLHGLGAAIVGRRYKWGLMISKTAAGTATPILQVRVGTAGTTSDTSRLTFTWGAGTAAIDRGEIELDLLVTTAGASGIIRGKANWTTNLATTGLTNAVKALQVTSAAFDLTVANSIIGLSYNGGTSASHTIEECRSWQDTI